MNRDCYIIFTACERKLTKNFVFAGILLRWVVTSAQQVLKILYWPAKSLLHSTTASLESRFSQLPSIEVQKILLPNHKFMAGHLSVIKVRSSSCSFGDFPFKYLLIISSSSCIRIEVVWENVSVLKNSGETVSVDGTHLGHNLPDKKGNRYCINLVSVAGKPETSS